MAAENNESRSEKELAQEIMAQLQENPDIDATDIELHFEDGELHIDGTLQTEEELEALIEVIEEYIDTNDYVCEVEVLENEEDEDYEESDFRGSVRDKDSEFEDDELEEVDEEDFDLDEEDEDFEDNKW